MAAAALLALLAAAPAFAADWACPATIRTRQSVAEKPLGWQAYSELEGSAQPLLDVRFYEGAADDMTVLDPDPGSDEKLATWTFPAEQKIWQVCVYGDTTMMLLRPLRPDVKACRVSYLKGDSEKGRRTVRSVECR